VLTIWGRTTSINTQKVLWTAAELGLPFERRDAGGPFGGLDSDDYRRLNPNGRIPTAVDDGAVLWESNAIVRYLAARYGDGALWIDDPLERALAEPWMDWQHTTLLDDMRTVFVGMADIPAAAWCHRYFSVPVDREGLPALGAWYARMGERAAYRTHVMAAPL
jgi:glutathione S-transferase